MIDYKNNQIIKKVKLNDSVTKMEIYSPFISKKAEPGEFIILRVNDNGERIPLTIAGYDREKGTITIIFQTVGSTTMLLNNLEENDIICDLVGPLGTKTKTEGLNKVCVIGGGVGCAIAYPVCKKLHQNGCVVHSIIGFRNKDLIILEDDFNTHSDKLIVMTDDGSYGSKGFVTDGLEELIKTNIYDEVIAIGPLIMMKNVVSLTKKYNIKTIVSMNPIMIDGTGMCGCCRLMVGGQMKFACIDGPEFDGFEVDFDEAISRSKSYLSFEKSARDRTCNLFKKEVK